MNEHIHVFIASQHSTHKWRDSMNTYMYSRVLWLIHMFHATNAYVCHHTFIHMFNVKYVNESRTKACVWHDTFTSVTRLMSTVSCSLSLENARLYDWVMSHVRTTPWCTSKYVQWHTYEWVMAHISMSHGSAVCMMSHVAHVKHAMAHKWNVQ